MAMRSESPTRNNSRVRASLVSLLRRAVVGVARSAARVNTRDHAGALRDARHVENQRDAAVAHDGRAREHVMLLNCLPSGLTTISSVSFTASTTSPN